MSTELGLGKIVTGRQQRDAVHVAVIPTLAIRELRPGEHLANGVVDPFLKENVQPGQTCWLLLYPNTVTSLRHAWTHPAFPDEQTLPPKRRSEADVWAKKEEVTA